LHAIILVALLALSSPLAQAADTGPDPGELLFWQSAERQGTPQAYRAYLTRYPSGFFAPLAASAIGKPAAPPSAPVTASAPAVSISPIVASTATLKPFSEEAPSGAVSFRLGQEFIGPQAVVAGSFGARKQLPLPEGRWVALMADDQTVTLPSIYANFPPVPRQRVTTVVFGKFFGTRLASALSFSFSSQKAPSTTNWSSVEGCERSGEVRLRTALPRSSGYRTECTALAFVAQPLATDAPAASQILVALAKLGATATGPALVSSLSFSERERGYYGVSRYDWPVVWLGDEAQNARGWRADGMEPPREQFATRLWAWLKAYRNVASSGYENDIGGADAMAAEFDPKVPVAIR